MTTIHAYINRRYHRWSEYAVYQCSVAGLSDQAGDVLNEVLLNLLAKDIDKLEKLYERQKGKYRELDYYVLRMINLNAHSKTSPYRYKYRQPLIDSNVSASYLSEDDEDALSEDDVHPSQGIALIVEEQEDFSDSSEETCNQYDTMREIVESLDITDFERRVFKWRFMAHEAMTEWPGPENMNLLYASYNKVKNLVTVELDKKIITTAIKKAIENLPGPNDKALARLIYIYGFPPEDLRTAGFPVKYLFPIYHRTQDQLKQLATNYLNLTQ